jgi:Uma2 family endonuclease
MLPPLLVIEVVSPGEIQRERDYIAKRSQYQDCEIPEYWIVDPQTQTILVLELRGNTYTEIGNFSNDDLVKFSIFSQLNLKVSQVFNQEN